MRSIPSAGRVSLSPVSFPISFPNRYAERRVPGENLFGDWFGHRSKLAAHGIKPSLLFIVDPFGSVMGGQRRGVSNYDLLCLDLLVGTRLFGLKGGQFHVGFAANFGTSLSTHYVGNNFPIQLADVAGVQPRLTYLSFTQSLFSDRLTVRFGRVTVNSVYGEENSRVPLSGHTDA